MPIDAIAFTADWLCRTHPVQFTGIAANAHKMAHPHALFQRIVADCPDYWRTEHQYAPEPGKRAGVRAAPFPLWRDEVLLPALRLYRARLEGVSIHTVPEVRYAYKRERDTTGARAVRSILGFAWRTEPIDNDLANADDTHPNEPAPTEDAGNEPKRAPKRARSEEEPVHEAMRDFAA